MIVVFFVTMFIKKFFFGSKTKTTKANAKQDNCAKALCDLNQELNNLYGELAKEQEVFADKKSKYENHVDAITSKKIELCNRLDYLQGIKHEMIKQITDSIELKEFKELCQTYVCAYDDMESVSVELHSLEVDLEENYVNWHEDNKEHTLQVNLKREQISDIIAEIAFLSTKTK